jgi:hypothetical protein
VKRHYRDQLSLADLSTTGFYEEVHCALHELHRILHLTLSLEKPHSNSSSDLNFSLQAFLPIFP